MKRQSPTNQELTTRVAKIVAEQCEVQGIPLRVEDPVTLSRIARLLNQKRVSS